MKGEGRQLFAGIPPPTSGKAEDIIVWAANEMHRLEAVIEAGLIREVEFLNVAPAKPREGMVRGADGTNWNPGGGKGVYAYYSGTWNKL